MKLRNKKTGEIKPAEAREDGIYLYDKTTDRWYKYELDLLARWWEYYEESKDFYYITGDGSIAHGTEIIRSICRYNEQIGNYFETEEEAERAVERLRAWKRLKDKGFRFSDYYIPAGEMYFDMEIPKDSLDEIAKDMGVCFGGGE